MLQCRILYCTYCSCTQQPQHTSAAHAPSTRQHTHLPTAPTHSTRPQHTPTAPTQSTRPQHMPSAHAHSTRTYPQHPPTAHTHSTRPQHPPTALTWDNVDVSVLGVVDQGSGGVCGHVPLFHVQRLHKNRDIPGSDITQCVPHTTYHTSHITRCVPHTAHHTPHTTHHTVCTAHLTPHTTHHTNLVLVIKTLLIFSPQPSHTLRKAIQ